MKPEMEMGQRPKTRSDLEQRVVDGESVVLDRQTDKIHQLNETASFIWARCDGEHSVSDIAAELATEFSTDQSTVDTDVPSAIEEFEKLGLLESLESVESPSH